MPEMLLLAGPNEAFRGTFPEFRRLKNMVATTFLEKDKAVDVSTNRACVVSGRGPRPKESFKAILRNSLTRLKIKVIKPQRLKMTLKVYF